MLKLFAFENDLFIPAAVRDKNKLGVQLEQLGGLQILTFRQITEKWLRCDVNISPEIMEVLHEGMIYFHLMLQVSMLVVGTSKWDLGFLSYWGR